MSDLNAIEKAFLAIEYARQARACFDAYEANSTEPQPTDRWIGLHNEKVWAEREARERVHKVLGGEPDKRLNNQGMGAAG